MWVLLMDKKSGGVRIQARLCFGGVRHDGTRDSGNSDRPVTPRASALVAARNAAALLQLDSFRHFLTAAMRRHGLGLPSDNSIRVDGAQAMQAEHGARPGRHQTQQHEDLAIAVDTSAANEDQPRTRNLFIAFTHSKDALWAALGFVAVLPFSFAMCMQMCSDSSVDVEGSTVLPSRKEIWTRRLVDAMLNADVLIFLSDVVIHLKRASCYCG